MSRMRTVSCTTIEPNSAFIGQDRGKARSFGMLTTLRCIRGYHYHQGKSKYSIKSNSTVVRDSWYLRRNVRLLICTFFVSAEFDNLDKDQEREIFREYNPWIRAFCS
jgi:hypothetical protein